MLCPFKRLITLGTVDLITCVDASMFDSYVCVSKMTWSYIVDLYNASHSTYAIRMYAIYSFLNIYQKSTNYEVVYMPSAFL